MDIFKQNRYLWMTIIVLLIMNLAALTLLWFGRPEGRRPQGGLRAPVEKQNRIQHLLKKELDFDENQIKQYLRMRREHRNQVQHLEGEIRQIKKQMFDEVLQDNPQQELSDSLLTIAQEKQAQLEQLTFQHVLELKQLCKAEQRDKLKLLIHQIFRPKGPPPPGDDFPPPPPRN